MGNGVYCPVLQKHRVDAEATHPLRGQMEACTAYDAFQQRHIKKIYSSCPEHAALAAGLLHVGGRIAAQQRRAAAAEGLEARLLLLLPAAAPAAAAASTSAAAAALVITAPAPATSSPAAPAPATPFPVASNGREHAAMTAFAAQLARILGLAKIAFNMTGSRMACPKVSA